MRTIPMIFATSLALIHAPAFSLSQAELDATRADCRLEGEAGGLDGGDLEAFVRDCVSELAGVTFVNQTGEPALPATASGRNRR